LAAAEAAERRARVEYKAAAKALDNAIRDAVALSIKRIGDDLSPYRQDDLADIGRLAIQANLLHRRHALRRSVTQDILRQQPANPSL
jgi:hypothetical protein